MRRDRQELAAVGGHAAQLGGRRLCAEAEERERRAQQDRLAELQRHVDQDGGPAVECEVAPDQGAVAEADGAAGFHVFLLHDRLCRAARDAGDRGDRGDAQRDDQREKTGAHHRRDGEAEQDRREREQHVDQAHQRLVEALEVGGAQSDQGAKPAAHQNGGNADAQGRAQAEQNAAHHVAALVVRTEQEVGAARAADRAEAQAHVGRVGIERRDPGREDRGADDHDQEQGRGRGGRIAQDAAPHGVLAPDRGDGALVGFALQGQGRVGHPRAILGSR